MPYRKKSHSGGGGTPTDLSFITAGAGDIVDGKIGADTDGEQVEGTLVVLDTSDATMAAGDLVAPATGYGAAGTKVTGTLIKNPTVDPLVINPNVVMYPMEAAWLLHSNTISGDIANFPSDLKNIIDQAGNLTGDIATLSANVKNVMIWNAVGIVGDLADIQSTILDSISFLGCANVSGVYSPNATIDEIVLSGTGMSAADTDATLIALNTITTVSGLCLVNANRTEASDAAVAALTLAGWSFTD